MTDTSTPELVKIKNWPFMVKHPAEINQTTRIMLLLHGHLGNEKVMWVLTKPLPDNYILLAPRAPIEMGPDQYSWHEITKQWPKLESYREVTGKLLSTVQKYLENFNLEKSHYDVMGFSQGAVMAYALALLYPEKIRKIAALAGFLPQSWKDNLKQEILKGKSFFVAHGTQDEIVPIEKSIKASQWLKENGAEVTFCEADTGHKLSSNCFKGLGDFFRK